MTLSWFSTRELSPLPVESSRADKFSPYMITVATTLDVPIKLQFKAASKQSMLGLGDIVIPGMVIAWALRLDLWLYYAKRIKYESKSLELVLKEKDGTIVNKTDIKHMEVKAVYVNAKGNWGERFWLRNTFFLTKPAAFPPDVAATDFPKTYFIATMVGYLLGMVVTLAMLITFQHGQPALLYLVPGVLGSIYATALVKGELKKIWSYTEDGTLDQIDVVVDLDANGNVIKPLGVLKDGVVDTTKKDDQEEKKDVKDDQKAVVGDKKTDKEEESSDDKNKSSTANCLFSVSLEVPTQDEL